MKKEVRRRIALVAHAPTASFVELTRIARLDPKHDFRGMDLQRVDFLDDDVGNFDFSNADLRFANFSRARGLDRVKLDGALLDSAILPHQDAIDINTLKRILLSGLEAPPAWRLSIVNLDFSGLPLADLTAFQSLANLEVLNLNTTRVKNLDPLRHLHKLRSLSLSGTSIREISPLAGSPHLESLWINDTKISDVSPLADIRSLRRLFIDGTTIQSLKSLTSLRDLTVYFDGKKLSPYWGDIAVPSASSMRRHEINNEISAPTRPWQRGRLI